MEQSKIIDTMETYQATEPPEGVGLSICNLGDPHHPPPPPDPEVGLRRLPGPREDGEVLEPA